MYTFYLKLKKPAMSYENVKVICRSCVASLNKTLFVDLGVSKMFYSSTLI